MNILQRVSYWSLCYPHLSFLQFCILCPHIFNTIWQHMNNGLYIFVYISMCLFIITIISWVFSIYSFIWGIILVIPFINIWNKFKHFSHIWMCQTIKWLVDHYGLSVLHSVHNAPVPLCRFYSRMRTNRPFKFARGVIPVHSYPFE